MKKKITILILALILILTTTLTLTANAADATASLSTVEAQHPGEEFTITFSAKCMSELEGIDSNLIYDKDKLEFIEADKANSNWVVMDTDLSDVQNSNYDRNIAVYCNQAKTEDDIFVMTFKVKETAPVDTTAKISLNGIVLYDANSQSYDIGTKEIQVSIVEEATNPEDNPTDNPDNTPNEPTDDPIDNPDNTPNEPTDDPVDNPDNIPNEPSNDPTDKPTDDSDFEEIKDKDDTKSENKMPDTGISSVIGMIAVVAVFGVLGLIKYNKYKEI